MYISQFQAFISYSKKKLHVSVEILSIAYLFCLGSKPHFSKTFFNVFLFVFYRPKYDISHLTALYVMLCRVALDKSLSR